ncbi:MAG: hypothetical protein COA78_32450 [Blastopirellula sp.]|nr:MAG: hypothetical protein COA78_32450 [Blastopirellula sp.]
MRSNLSPYHILYFYRLLEIGTTNDRIYWIYDLHGDAANLRLREIFPADQWKVDRSRIFSDISEAFSHDNVLGNISDDDLNLLKQHHAANQPGDGYHTPFLIPAKLAVSRCLHGDSNHLDCLLDS